MKRLTILIMLIISNLSYSNNRITRPDERHRIFIEPDFSWNMTQKYKEEDMIISQSGHFLGLNAGYEFINPDDLYFGVEAFLSFGNRFSEVKEYGRRIDASEATATRNKVEGFLGYTLKADNFSLIPFSGIGGYFLSQEEYNLDLAYVPLGIKVEYHLKDLSLGVKGEQMRFLHYWEHLDAHKASGNIWAPGNYGYEVSLPVSFKSDRPGDNWNACIEPYYLKLLNGFSFIGGRVSAIYHF